MDVDAVWAAITANNKEILKTRTEPDTGRPRVFPLKPSRWDRLSKAQTESSQAKSRGAFLAAKEKVYQQIELTTAPQNLPSLRYVGLEKWHDLAGSASNASQNAKLDHWHAVKGSGRAKPARRSRTPTISAVPIARPTTPSFEFVPAQHLPGLDDGLPQPPQWPASRRYTVKVPAVVGTVLNHKYPRDTMRPISAPAKPSKLAFSKGASMAVATTLNGQRVGLKPRYSPMAMAEVPSSLAFFPTQGNEMGPLHHHHDQIGS